MWGHRMWRWLSWRGVQKRLRQKQSHGVRWTGVSALSTDFRNSVDVMTTETTV